MAHYIAAGYNKNTSPLKRLIDFAGNSARVHIISEPDTYTRKITRKEKKRKWHAISEPDTTRTL